MIISTLIATSVALASAKDAIWPVETALPDVSSRVEVNAGDKATWRFEGSGWVINEARWQTSPATTSQLAKLLLPLGSFVAENPIPFRTTTSLTAVESYGRAERQLDIPGARLNIRVTVQKDSGSASGAASPDAQHADYWRAGLPSGKARTIGDTPQTNTQFTKSVFEVSFVRGRMHADVALYARDGVPPNADLVEAIAKAIEFRAVKIPEIGLDGVAPADRERLLGEYVSLSSLAAKGATTKSFVQNGSKFATVTAKGRTYTFEQLSWYAQTPNGRVELGSPAIPYDGDLYVPASFVKGIL